MSGFDGIDRGVDDRKLAGMRQEPVTFEQLDEVMESCKRAFRDEVLFGTGIVGVIHDRQGGKTLMGLARLKQLLDSGHSKQEAFLGALEAQVVICPRRSGRNLVDDAMYGYRVWRRRWGWIRSELLKELKNVR